MATLDAGLFGSITDIANRSDPDGRISSIVNTLARMSPAYADSLWRPTNDKVSHQTVRVTALPAVYRRRLNEGVNSSKGATSKVVDRLTMIEARSKVDAELKEVEGDNFNAFRSSEDAMFLEVFTQRFEYDLFYATTVSDAEDMSGLAQRYASTSGTWGGNVILGGGAGSDNMSIYLVTWDEMGAHCIYPKNSKAGFDHEDLGRITVQDSSQREYLAYVSLFKMRYGLALRDPRTCVRIANIDSSALERTVSTGADLYSLLEQALEKTHVGGAAMGRKCFYAPRKAFNFLFSQARTSNNAQLTLSEAQTGGPAERKWTPYYLGVPIKLCDALTEAEAAIS